MKKLVLLIIQYRNVLFTNFLAAIGVLMTLKEVLSLFIDEVSPFSKNLRPIEAIAIVAISIIYAGFSVFRKREKITFDINKRTTLTIKMADLLTAPGVRVIPVNEYFDTHNGDGIINPTSLHGKFNDLFSNDISKLQEQINKELSAIAPIPHGRKRTMIPNLPQKRYPLGTCIRVHHNADTYILVAITRFNEYEHVEVKSEEYPEIVRKMFNGINQLHNGEPVYIPLIGSGISGYQLTDMQMTNTIIQTAYNSNGLTITKGITLCIYNNIQLKKLNLNILKYLFNRWKTLK